MLDQEIWLKSFITKTDGSAFSDNVSYLIGGPTIEMLCDSYNKKNGYTEENENFAIPELKTSVGYEWSLKFNGYLNTNPWKTSAYWIASPATYLSYRLLQYENGRNRIYYMDYTTTSNGFRPVICLNSDVELKINTREDGSFFYSVD